MSKMLVDVEGKPKTSQLIGSVIQQLLANIAATITVPIVIGLSDFISSAILGCGLGTLVYFLITKRKSPVILSSNFAFIGALITAMSHAGFTGIVIGGFLTGLVYIILSLIVRLAGTDWIRKVFPPIIIGPVVALIGLGLSTSAIIDLVSADNYMYEGGHPYNLIALLCGLVTFFVIVIVTIQNRNKKLSLVPFLFGILAGYSLAIIFTLIGNATNNTYLMIADFSPLINNFKDISVTSFVSLPKLSFVEMIKDIQNGNVNIDGVGVAQIALSFIPISLVGFSEHIADHTALGNIIGRDLINGEPGLSRTLLGDGLGSIAGTWFGICPNTTYGEAIACVAVTKNASTITIFVTALTCIGLSFFTPLIAFFRTIPTCVIGGMCLSLFGFIAVSGLKMLKDVDLNKDKNIFTLSIIFVSGIGLLTLRIPYEFELIDPATNLYIMSSWIEVSSTGVALLLGMLTYAIASLIEKHNLPEQST